MKNTSKLVNNIMLIGGMKCGTSSLYRWLEFHPQIATPSMKEPEYFSDNYGPNLEVSEYLELFKLTSGVSRFTLDASTGYAKYPYEQNVARKIFEYNRNAKIIYVVRNPFDRIVSHYGHLQTKLNKVPNITSNKFIHFSNYNSQLRQYIEFFPENQILILDFDYLKNEPVKTLDLVFDFLGLEERIYPDSYEVRNKTSQKPSYRLRRLRKTFSRLIPFVPEKIKILVKIKVSQQKKKTILNTEERKYIKDQLHEDMIGFGKKYNFNVKKWGFHE